MMGTPVTDRRVRELRRGESALIPQSISYLGPLKRVGRRLVEGSSPGSKELAGIAERFEVRPADLHEYPFHPSGGMARGILLATVLLIIADEPTPGLSVDLTRQMLVPSGYGKTTLGKIMAGWIRRYQGRVNADERPLPVRGAAWCNTSISIRN